EVEPGCVPRYFPTRRSSDLVPGLLALVRDRGINRGAGCQRPGGDVVGEREGQAAHRGGDRVQLDFPGAGQRQGEVAEVVADERAPGEEAAAPRPLAVHEDLA